MTAESDQKTCALWWDHCGETDFELFGTEQEAAESAASLEDSDCAGEICGVQFADGRLVRAPDWEVLHRERREYAERSARRRQERQAAPPPPPTKTLRDPFNGHEFTIVVGDEDWPPAWVGSRLGNSTTPGNDSAGTAAPA